MATQQPLPGLGSGYQVPERLILPLRDQPLYRVAANAKQCSLLELLTAILAGYKKDGTTLAQEVVSYFKGDLAAISHASVPALMQVKGMTRKAAVALTAALVMGERAIEERMNPVERPTINSPADAAALVLYDMSGLEKEEMRVMMLDTRNRVMDFSKVTLGSVNSSQIRTSELFTEAVRRLAPAIMLFHNHPSGDPCPSPDDVAVTRAAVQAGNLLSITVLDHIVIGKGKWVSLRERGLGFS